MNTILNLKVRVMPFLYYDDPNVFDGAYKRDTFYFKLEPFNFPDLDEIKPGMLNFPGTMVTGNIFKPFKEVTRLQDDLSLGFYLDTKKAGEPIYGNMGNFSGRITMSNDGLEGDGLLRYLNCSLQDEKFVFLPDSTVSNVNSMELAKYTYNNHEFPVGHGEDLHVQWIPGIDSMLIWNNDKKKPIRIFDQKLGLFGNIVLGKDGMKGKGMMQMEKAKLHSDLFNYTHTAFSADTSFLEIKTDKKSALNAFTAPNVRSHIDMEDRIGEFSSNGGKLDIALPYNQYRTEAADFVWLMDDNLINLRMPEDSGGYFVSTHPKQDGLKFKASGGVINLVENTIKVDGIPYIVVGDAKIKPADASIFIGKDAVIKTLEKATLVCDTTNEYHTISKAKLDIEGKKTFKGSGTYQYRGKNMKQQKIVFDDISTKEHEERKLRGQYYTYANTKIPEDQIFKLSHNIEYKGNAVLDSRFQYMVFDGFAKIDLVTDYIELDWFKFTDEINPENVQIDVSNPINERGDTLDFGIAQHMSDFDIYALFLSQKKTPRDDIIFETGGKLEYDDEENVYRVGNIDKLNEKTELGNVLTLHDDEDLITAEGIFDLGDHQMVNVDAAGTMELDLDSESSGFNDMILGYTFDFDKKLLNQIGDNFIANNVESEDIEYGEEYAYAAMELVGQKKVDDFKKMLGEAGFMNEKMKGLDQDIILSHVNMVWNERTHTYRSKGKIGLKYIGDQYVGKMIEGAVEFGIRQNGDFFTIYLETEPSEKGVPMWYYFTYKKGNMESISSEREYNVVLRKLMDRKSAVKEDKKRGFVYQYSIAPMAKRLDFMYEIKGSDYEDPVVPQDETLEDETMEGDEGIDMDITLDEDEGEGEDVNENTEPLTKEEKLEKYLKSKDRKDKLEKFEDKLEEMDSKKKKKKDKKKGKENEQLQDIIEEDIDTGGMEETETDKKSAKKEKKKDKKKKENIEEVIEEDIPSKLDEKLEDLDERTEEEIDKKAAKKEKKQDKKKKENIEEVIEEDVPSKLDEKLEDLDERTEEEIDKKAAKKEKKQDKKKKENIEEVIEEDIPSKLDEKLEDLEEETDKQKSDLQSAEEKARMIQEELERNAERKEEKAKKKSKKDKKKEEAEQKAKEEAEQKAKEEAEQKAKEEAEQKAKEEAEQKAKEEAEQKAKAEAEQKAKAEAEQKAKGEAEQKAKAEAEQKAKEEAEQKAKAEAEQKAKEEAEQKAKEEAEQKAKEEAEQKAKEEAEQKAKEEAEQKAKEEAEQKAKAEAEQKAKEEAEQKAKEEAEQKAKEEAEQKAKEEAEQKAKAEAEQKAKAEAEQKAKEEAEQKAKAEAEQKAKAEAEQKAKAEAEQKAKAEAEQKAKEEAEQKAKEEAEQKAKEEAEQKAKEEAEQKAKEEAEQKAKAEAEQKAKEEAEQKAKEEAEQKAKEEAEQKAKEEAEQKAKEEAEQKAKEEAEQKAKEEAEQKAKEETEQKAKEEAEQKAKAEAEQKAKEENAKGDEELEEELDEETVPDEETNPDEEVDDIKAAEEKAKQILEEMQQQSEDDKAGKKKDKKKKKKKGKKESDEEESGDE